MCLWDATVVVADGYNDLECHWCLSSNECVPSDDIGNCPPPGLGLSNESHSICPELQCHLAPIAFNVYACLPSYVTLFWFNVALLIWCIILFLWVRAIGQKPWSVQGLCGTARMRWEGNEITPQANTQDLEEAFDHVDEGFDAEYTEVLSTATGLSQAKNECRHCKKGRECDWCNMTRIAFLPLLMTATTAISNMFATLLFSLRINFFIPYMCTTLLLGVLSHVVFYVKFLRPLNKGNSVWDPLYIRLAFMLRGRRIESVFARHREGDSSEDENAQTLRMRKGSIPYLAQMPSFFGGLYDRVSAAVATSPTQQDAEAREALGEDVPDAATTASDGHSTASPHEANAASSSAAAQADDQVLCTPPAPQPQASSSSAALRPPIPLRNPLNAAVTAGISTKPPLASAGSMAMLSRRSNSMGFGSNVQLRDSRQAIVEENMQDMTAITSAEVPLLVESENDPLVATMQNMDAVLKARLLQALSSEEDVENEKVVWASTPLKKHLIMHDITFLHLCATIVVSSALFFSIASDPQLKVYKIIGAANLHVVGVLAVIIPAVLVALFVRSCDRMYIVTTHNVVTLSKGFVGVNIAVHANQDIRCGLVSRYKEFGMNFAAFSWRQPSGAEKRRMPALPFSEFSCINNGADMKNLLDKVRRFCPPLSGGVWKGSTEEMAQEWRLLMALAYGTFLMCCTTFHYTNVVPVHILILTFVCCASFCVAIFSKGLRSHFTLNTPFDTSRRSSKWHKPTWQAKVCSNIQN